MPNVGRNTWTGGLIAVWAACMAGAGCQMSLNFGLPKDQPSEEIAQKPGVSSWPNDPSVKTNKPSPLPGVGQFRPNNPQHIQAAYTPEGNTPREAPLSGDPQGNKEPNGKGKPNEQTGTEQVPPGVPGPYPGGGPVPTEQHKTLLPYLIEPPDILLLDAVRLIPRPPYRTEPLDVLQIEVSPTYQNQPISGLYQVGPDGNVNLGFSYRSVRVYGLTQVEAQEAIRKHLLRVTRLENPRVDVTIAQSRALQQIRGEHLVRPDGTISLGTYGCVNVTGLTIAQAEWVVEQYLSKYLLDPEVSIDVFAYNSKGYYVITDGAGFGQQVFKFPFTGNDTVLDAIQNLGGLPPESSKKRIWVARPAPAKHGCYQVLPVDWLAIVKGGATNTNYQLFPGDRLYVESDALIRFDNVLAKIIAPVERLFGVTLLGVSTVRAFSNNNNNAGIGFIGGF